MALNIRDNQVMIEIACNDPDNGVFAHRAEMIEIGHDFLDLEVKRHPPRFVEIPPERVGGKEYVRLAGKRWPIRGCKEWFGNWCWNGYWLDIPVAVDFLVWLHSRKLFHCSCGEERIYNIWNNEARSLDNKDDRAFLDRLLGKPSTHRVAA